MIKKLYIGLCAVAALFASCSDVELEATKYSETVKNLKTDYQNGSRKVTLTWDNPTMSGQSGIQIIKDNVDVTNIDEVVNSYFIRKAPTNVDVAYTVKVRYADGRVSEGQTVRFNIPYEVKKGSKVAMLVANDYNVSDDEKDAVAWFEKNYVEKGLGNLVTPATIDELDIEDHAVCWVMCDRIGVELGWDKLPGGLADAETINALKAFTTDGGSLLLTNHATQLTVAVGRISDAYAPRIFGNGEGGQNPDVWGSQPVIGNTEGQIYDHSEHPIYAGMNFTAGIYERSIYCFEGAGVKGDHNCMWDLNSYGLAPNPNVVKAWEDMTNSTVLGTWNHVVDYCCAGIIDFAPTTTFAGRILAIGLASYEWNIGGENQYKDQLEMFTSNCIGYLK